MSLTDPYAVLGVSRDASADDIRTAYRKLARQYHPDVNPDNPAAEEKFKEASQAYAVLSDDEKRARFDQTGSIDEVPNQDYFQNVNFSDLFEAMMGGFGTSSRASRSAGRNGEDLRAEVTLELLDVLTGVEKPINYRRMSRCSVCSGSGAAPGTQPETCGTCKGQGMVTRVQDTFIGSIRTSTTCPTCGGAGKQIKSPCENCKGRGLEVVDADISVNVPPGIEDGMTLRVSGRGSDGVGAGVAGDLYVVVHVKQDSRFVRNGADLHTEVELTFPQAALGDKFKLRGLTDDLDLSVKAGTQPGHEFRFKGEGLPRLHSGARGSLFVRARVNVPSKVSEEEAELLRKYAEMTGGPIPKGEEGGFLGTLFGKKKK